jgi:16S rRNA (cytosine967-C5)-methyltransferase
MEQRLRRHGDVQVVTADATALPPSTDFDRVLADVPCSGTGTLARNPEIKWRLEPADLADLHARQVNILRAALAKLKPGGRLVYSTCSLEAEENEDVVAEVLNGNKHFKTIDVRTELEQLRREGELVLPDSEPLLDGHFLRIIPGKFPTDGFFAAVIERIF